MYTSQSKPLYFNHHQQTYITSTLQMRVNLIKSQQLNRIRIEQETETSWRENECD